MSQGVEPACVDADCYRNILTPFERCFRPEQYDYLVTQQAAVGSAKGIKLRLRKPFNEFMPNRVSGVEAFYSSSSMAHFIGFYSALKNGMDTKGMRVVSVISTSGRVFGRLPTMLGELRA